MVGLASIFMIYIAYNNYSLINLVVKDINSENLYNYKKIETISGAYSNLSNNKCAWGFVRKPNGQQPDFYEPYIKPLNEYEGIYVGNPNNKIIYLTFDEGYENGYTSSILDTLKEKDVSAAFFVTMPYVKQNSDLIKRMVEEGHIVRKSHSKQSIYA